MYNFLASKRMNNLKIARNTLGGQTAPRRRSESVRVNFQLQIVRQCLLSGQSNGGGVKRLTKAKENDVEAAFAIRQVEKGTWPADWPTMKNL